MCSYIIISIFIFSFHYNLVPGYGINNNNRKSIELLLLLEKEEESYHQFHYNIRRKRFGYMPRMTVFCLLLRGYDIIYTYLWIRNKII